MQQNNAVDTDFNSKVVDRIESLRTSLKLKKRAFCEQIGFSEKTYGQMTGPRKSRPNLELISVITEKFGVSPAWLLMGAGPMYQGEEAGQVNEGEVVYIPRLDVQASAGDGTVVDSEEVKETRPFNRSEIVRFRTNPENLTIIEVRGESMQPTLNPGDEVMVDVTWPRDLVDGIYAVRVNQTLMLKRVRQLPGNKLVVISDNEAYPPFEVDGAEGEDVSGDFQIIGRVVWGAKRY